MSARVYGNPEFLIGTRAVGPGHPCYVIAEAGSNHNRDLPTALRLIEVAADAGADAVKFQTYTAEGLYSRRTPDIKYLKSRQLVGDFGQCGTSSSGSRSPGSGMTISPVTLPRTTSRSSRRHSRRPLSTLSRKWAFPPTRSPRTR